MCPILNVTEIELFGSPDVTALNFVYVVEWRAKFVKGKMDTRDEFLARILDAATTKNKHEDELKRTTFDLRRRVAKCIEIGCGSYEYLLWTVTNLSLKH